MYPWSQLVSITLWTFIWFGFFLLKIKLMYLRKIKVNISWNHQLWFHVDMECLLSILHLRLCWEGQSFLPLYNKNMALADNTDYLAYRFKKNKQFNKHLLWIVFSCAQALSGAVEFNPRSQKLCLNTVTICTGTHVFALMTDMSSWLHIFSYCLSLWQDLTTVCVFAFRCCVHVTMHSGEHASAKTCTRASEDDLIPRGLIIYRCELRETQDVVVQRSVVTLGAVKFLLSCVYGGAFV